jgi:UDP-N-acetylglucosamine 4-epimerase
MTTPPSAFAAVREALAARPRTWLVTGAAGFIGSHLVEQLLLLDQQVVGLDNFATGHRRNLTDVLSRVSPGQAERFAFREGDIRDPAACAAACAGVDVVLHQAALGSVPRSIQDPLQTHETNVTGFLRVLVAARDAGVRRIVYASSSSVYGDHPGLPKVEASVGMPLSPYAAGKYADELYAEVFSRCYGLELVGLRYFNVFGPRQDPNGPYAAVIPRWFAAMLDLHPVVIHGDGETSRDFCFVENVVQANLLAATTTNAEALGEAYNVAYGARTTLNELCELIRDRVAAIRPHLRADVRALLPVHDELRPGDVRHSLADVSKARRLLGYVPTHSLREGLASTARWYEVSAAAARSASSAE